MLITSNDLLFIGWVVGFVDGEGCFSVSFNRKARLKTGIEVRPSFSISQKSNSRDCIEEFRSHFDCGSTRYSASDGTWKYETRSLDDICDKVIPFFQKYPLKTYKRNDFDLFCEICVFMKSNRHLSFQGSEEILQLAYQMNQSGTRKATLAELLKELRANPTNPNYRAPSGHVPLSRA